jgi:hypothetical protein
MKIAAALAAVVVLGLLALVALRLLDRRADAREWDRLAALQPVAPARFAPEMIEDLPEPARRFLAYVIAPGTPLLRVAEIDMTGQFSLGTKDAPAYRPMEARQILAAPEGFVWAMRTRGGMPVSGSDSGTWTRFRILGLLPVARLGGDPDHARSAFGLRISEGRLPFRVAGTVGEDPRRATRASPAPRPERPRPWRAPRPSSARRG